MKLFTVKNLSESVGEIEIYGYIADRKFYSDDVTLREITDRLKGLGNITELEIHINSYGGSVYVGNAIFNVIDAYKKRNNVKVTVYDEGIMASMASGIAMVGDEIIMYENSQMMIHPPLIAIEGNIEDLKKAEEILVKSEKALISNYMRHFNGTEEELKELMDKETWLDADEAYSYGLCTSVNREKRIAIAASAQGIRVGDVMYSKVGYISRLDNKATTETEDKGGDTFMEFLTKETVINAFEKEITADELLNFAKIGMAQSDELNSLKELNDGLTAEIEALKAENSAKDEKVKKFDKLFQAKVDECLSNGIKAKGDGFNVDLWRKVINQLDYDEVESMSNDFAKEAENRLHAGERISEPIRVITESAENAANKEKINF